MSILDVIQNMLGVGEGQVVERRTFGDSPSESRYIRVILEVLSNAVKIYNHRDLRESRGIRNEYFFSFHL